MYRGATYRFANAQNRARFLAAPSRYEPAYGGWCAYAMASDDRVEVDPKSFRIEDGSLLLFYNGFLANTRKKWGKEGSDKLFPKADANWFKFSSEMRKREAAAFHHENGLVIGGYDPVAYSQGAASMGDEGITVEHRGLTYRFATEANREAFLNDPDRYEPAYGGWCAYAMAKGQKVVPRAVPAGGRGHAALHQGGQRPARGLEERSEPEEGRRRGLGQADEQVARAPYETLPAPRVHLEVRVVA